MHRTDADANVGGLFSEGDPATGTPGTKIDAAWLNAVQEEIANVILAAGITLTKGDNTQLLQALQSGCARKAADQANSANPAWADVTDLSFPVEASGIYEFEFVLRVTALASTTGVDVKLSGTSSPVMVATEYEDLEAGGTFRPVRSVNAEATGYTATHVGHYTAGGGQLNRLRGIVRNGQVAGVVQLQARTGVNGSQVNILRDSFVRFRKIG